MNIYEEIVKLQREGRRGAVATIVNSRGSIPSFQSAKMLIRDDGSIAGTIGGGCVEAEVWQAARDVITGEKPRTLSFDLNQDPKYDTGLVCGGTLEIFIEPVLPIPLLYIFGAGHVALELFKTARNAGFDCIVADDRDAYANAERFPNALQVIAKDFDEALAETQPQRVLLHRHLPLAAIATTCASCAGPCKRPPATSAWSAQNAKPSPSFASSPAKASTPSSLTASILPSVSTSAPSLPKKSPSPSSPNSSPSAAMPSAPCPHMSWFHSGRHTAAAPQDDPISTPAAT